MIRGVENVGMQYECKSPCLYATYGCVSWQKIYIEYLVCVCVYSEGIYMCIMYVCVCVCLSLLT